MNTDQMNTSGIEASDHVILIIDDDPNSLAILSEYLEECDYTVLIAEDGESGLVRAEYARPDLILLDIMIPEMDGYETCRRLKELESTRDIPVIFMTALAETEHKIRGFAAGAVDYVTKPFQREEIVARVSVHLHIRELTAGLRNANETLEKRVEERTAELRAMNEKLAQELAERKRAEEALKKIEWMLTRKPPSAEGQANPANDQGYGDLTTLNHGGLILSSIDRHVLRGIASEYLDLLDTSSAIYEKNGDYAFGIFSSRWCRMMDLASRTLCHSDDNASALASGKWLCHESCWTDCSRKAIDTGVPVEIECNGGIRLYSVPVFAGDEVIGAINFGYGDPPKDPEKLRLLAGSYALDFDELIREAGSYDTRPPFIIEMAKQRLQVSARLIGMLVERKLAEEELSRMNERFALAVSAAGLGVWDWDIRNNELAWDDMMYALYGITKGDFSGAYEAWLQGVHPDDRASSDELSKRARRGEQEYDTEFRVVWPDGGIHWLTAYGRIERDGDGTPLRMTGINFDITERKRAEAEHLAHIRFLENLDRVNRVIQGAIDLNQMMNDTLETTLQLFDCDRSWLFYPCDPDAQSFLVPMEIARPEYPGAGILNSDVPMPPDMALNLLETLESAGPVTFGIGTDRPVNKVSAEQFGVQSMLMVALYPKVGKPWAFGLHQCSYPRVWTSEEQRLFQEISRRLADTLTGLLSHRDLQESEEALRKLNEELEQRVSERTKELERRNHELEEMNKVFVGRELRMAELKKRIMELENQTGAP